MYMYICFWIIEENGIWTMKRRKEDIVEILFFLVT